MFGRLSKFQPLSLAVGGMPGSPIPHRYETLEREKRFKEPPVKGPAIPLLDELAKPHIESFNALFDDSGLERGDTDGRGLLYLGINDIGPKTVFSGTAKGEPNSENPRGSKLTRECER
jgi:DNA-directed RNA polymerase I subunit RPA2